MTIDDFIRCMKLTPENVEERIAKIRHDIFGCYGGEIDYDCRPNEITLNGMSEGEEIKMTWDDVLEYMLWQQVRMW